jgi:quinol monooxygenase YgiN
MATTTANYLAVHQKGVLTEGSSDVFYKATLELGSRVMSQPGIARFDLLRSLDNGEEFLLIEVFKDRSREPGDFKQSQLYQDWRAVTEPLMAAPPVLLRTHRYFRLLRCGIPAKHVALRTLLFIKRSGLGVGNPWSSRQITARWSAGFTLRDNYIQDVRRQAGG